MEKEFKDFEVSDFTLEIRNKKKIIFRSEKEGILGLLDFIKKYGGRFKNLIIFDRVIGNAAALLCVYLKAKEVCGLIGSKAAKKTLKKFKINFYFKKTIPNILNKNKDDLCPLERLSILKTPEEFLDCLEK